MTLSIFRRQTTGKQPVYSPYLTVDIAFGAQGVNRSSSERSLICLFFFEGQGEGDILSWPLL